MPQGFRVAAIGELLWDMLPDGPQLGGAPANFAAMSAHLADSGDEIFLVSRVGDDLLGRRALDPLRRRSVHAEHISTDPKLPTGTVAVEFNADGNPAYRICENVAWDHIPEAPQLAGLAATLDAVCFGTLAQRSPEARATIRQFLQNTKPACVRIFDVNLRAPFWTPDIVAWSCAHSTVLKMNHEEVPLVAQALGVPPYDRTDLQAARFMLAKFPIELVAITRGAKGSLLVTPDATDDHSGVAVDVVDTIGAGDAFTAALAHGLLRGHSLPSLAEAANRWGAWAASQSGGMAAQD